MAYKHYTDAEIAYEKQKVMEYITTYLVENQVVPTLYEINDALNIPYVRVWRLINTLIADGKLIRANADEYKHRVYRVPGYRVVKVD